MQSKKVLMVPQLKLASALLATALALCSAPPALAQNKAQVPTTVRHYADGSTQVVKAVPRRVRRSNTAAAWVGTNAPATVTPAAAAALNAKAVIAVAGTAPRWVPLLNQIPDTKDPQVTPGTAHLMTDGTVLVQDAGTPDWWRLTPDIFGSYINGTWSAVASMAYGPLYFASAVLPDGRVLVEGGEFLDFNFAWTNQGAIYDPKTDSWQAVAPPLGWQSIGDAQSVVLANGTFMLANALTTESALFDARTFSWTPTGGGKADINDEEGWTLLSNGKLLTVDANNFSNLTLSEIYDPNTGLWTPAGSTGVLLADIGVGTQNSHELGPQVLRPDGTVFVAGGTGHTAIYDSKNGRWSAGPDFPASANGRLQVADGPGALLPNGNVLVVASAGVFQNGSRFFEFDGRRLNEVVAWPDAADRSSFEFVALILPTGEILMNNINSRNGSMVYTSGGGYRDEWAPKINSVPSILVAGRTYTLSGERLNGLSQGAAYGDDAQSATNYPLVRITNIASNHVFYARTHDHSSMAIGLQTRGSTRFDVPAGIEVGWSRLEVLTNGIPSKPVRVEVLR
jgi:hypothetical protein